MRSFIRMCYGYIYSEHQTVALSIAETSLPHRRGSPLLFWRGAVAVPGRGEVSRLAKR